MNSIKYHRKYKLQACKWELEFEGECVDLKKKKGPTCQVKNRRGSDLRSCEAT